MLPDPREVSAALRDALLIRSGLRVAGAHPKAEEISRLPLSQIAAHLGELAASRDPRVTFHNASQAIAAGLSTSDFGNAMASTARELMLHTYSELSEHRPLCASVEVQDFKPVEMSFLDAALTLEQVNQNAEIPAQHQAIVLDEGQTAQLSTYGRTLLVSRHLLLSDQWRILERAFATLGGKVSRLENAMVFAALESNPQLSDSEPLFHADLGNVEAGALDSTALASAMAKLRNQAPPGGEPTGHRARFLVTSPALEFAAIKLVHESGLDLSVVASPNIAAARWYLMADPALAPVVGRLHLPGKATRPFTLERATPKQMVDAIGMRLLADLGVVILSRVGIVRGGTVA